MNMSFIKSDDGFYINKDWIRFMTRRDDCFKLCATTDSCHKDNGNSFEVCKKNNEEFQKLSEISKQEFLPVNQDTYINPKWIRLFREDKPGHIRICTLPKFCTPNSYFNLSDDLYPKSCKLLKKN